MPRDHWHDEKGAQAESQEIDLDTLARFASEPSTACALIAVECAAMAKPQDTSIVPAITSCAKSAASFGLSREGR